ncbi:amidohydrolase family protein [Hansschlegelia zhihuaiae]|uniref:GntR family transcriptional regulator n=1 Tax=Hansschlegelia zhihuaiae TaxID=405005 RepID=A0A4Q0ML10_9HYPH|nr:amidohydrolase family protein [Hansschlegelia zhihuaiae]RXF74328.1 GntR family transcriptional regulator [Hansschlegelia zhihuaiae]
MPISAAPGEPPACPGPDPRVRGATRFTVPPGAVDCHAHVIGLPPAYPFVPERTYTPPEATEAAYLAMLDATGMSAGVLIQVSVHGTDNRRMIETLRAHPERLRGVAVVEPDAGEATLRELHAAGVRALRLNVLFGGGVGLGNIERYGAMAREMGWHLEFLLDAAVLPELWARLRRLPVDFVIDHMGHFPTSRGFDDPGFRALLALVAEGGWVKLSGAYRTSVDGAHYADVIPFARALADAAPERCVWGSDWPHVAHWAATLNAGDLLDGLYDWLPDKDRRRRVLVDNARRLYGFEPL